jgi:hypothetical protein
MAKYYPKSHLITGLFTSGKEWMDEFTSIEYKGPYYKNIDGSAFTGPKPSNLQAKLVPYIDMDAKGAPVGLFSEYDQLPKSTNVKDMIHPLSTYPFPIDKDYKKGFFIRYFVQKINDPTDPIREVTQKEFGRVTGNLQAFYFGVELKWKITGPKYDKLKQPGIVDTNKRTLFRKEGEMPGIIKRLPNLLEHSQFTEIVNIGDPNPATTPSTQQPTTPGTSTSSY